MSKMIMIQGTMSNVGRHFLRQVVAEFSRNL